MPFIVVIGMYTFCLPYTVYEIPFIKNTRQVWKYNFYPTVYLIFALLVQELYFAYNAYMVFEE